MSGVCPRRGVGAPLVCQRPQRPGSLVWRSEAKCGELTSRGLPAPGLVVSVVLLHPAGDGLPVVGPVVDALAAPDAVPLALLALDLHHVPRGGVERSAITATNNLKEYQLNHLLH